MRDWSDCIRQRDSGESICTGGRDFTKKSGNPAPWGPIEYIEGEVLDLTKKSMVSRQDLLPESDIERKRRKLEAEKRLLAQGSRMGLNKEGSAKAMQLVKRKIENITRRN